MMRQIILFLFLLFSTHQVFANQKADELRKTLSQAPDSARAEILVNIAKLFQYENMDSCVFYAQKAHDKGYPTRQYLAVIDAQTLLSQIALEKKDYTKATNHRRIIRDLAIRERLWDIAMENYNQMAQTWLLRNNYAEAVEELKRGLEIAIDRSNLELQKYYYQSLIEAYLRLNRIKEVDENYAQLVDVNLQIAYESVSSLTNALQLEYDELKKEAENEKNRWLQRSIISKVLNIFAVVWAVLASAAFVMVYFWFKFKFKPDTIKIQKELSKKTEELNLLIANQENAFRFLTNHVQTNINSLEQSISLFEAEQGDLPVAVDSPVNNISKKIRSLHEFFKNFTLLLQAQSGQLRPVLTTVNIPQLTANLIHEYNKEHDKEKAKRLINEVQNNSFAVADEYLMNNVLHQLTFNAVKYMHLNTGTITIGAKIGSRVNTDAGYMEDTDFVEIWVTDDGMELMPEQAEILFDSADNLFFPGDPETQDLRMRLAVSKAVVETMKGRIWAEAKHDEGLCIRFCLPRTKVQEVNTLSLVENTQEIISTEDTPLLLSE